MIKRFLDGSKLLLECVLFGDIVCQKNMSIADIKLPSKTTTLRFVGEFWGSNELIKRRLEAEIFKSAVLIERICSLILEQLI